MAQTNAGSPAEHPTVARQRRAKQDRVKIKDHANEVYLYTDGDRPCIDETYTRRDGNRPIGQATGDIFDSTMMQAFHDWQTSAADIFTPTSEAWLDIVPSKKIEGLGIEGTQQVKALLTGIEEDVFEEINRSDFYIASKPAWGDFSIAAYAIEIHPAPAGIPFPIEWVPLAELLIDLDAFGRIDGRWRQRYIEENQLPYAYPFVARGTDKTAKQWWAEQLGRDDGRLSSDDYVQVTHGYRRDLERAPREFWVYEIAVERVRQVTGKSLARRNIVYSHTYSHEGRGACGIIVAGAQRVPGSAWGASEMSSQALPMARNLDELRFLMNENMERRVNPAWMLHHSGEASFTEGFAAGTVYETSDEFNLQELVSQHDLGEPLFAIDQMQDDVRRSYFQDQPRAQAADGDIIHRRSAQYFDDQAQHARRLEQTRHSIYKDAIIPIVQRVIWLKQLRGEIDRQIKAGDQLVSYQPRSPLSEAADLQRFNLGLQMLNGLQVVQPQLLAAINGLELLSNAKNLLSLEWIPEADPEVYNQLLAAQLGAGPAGEAEQLQAALGQIAGGASGQASVPS